MTLTVVGLSFFVFAAWGLRGDHLDATAPPRGMGAFGSLGLITSAFFLSELGDKTQLATISIAGNQDSFAGVWLGSTAGMVAADAIAIAVGVLAGRHLPQRLATRVAAAIFVIFGCLALVRAASLVI